MFYLVPLILIGLALLGQFLLLRKGSREPLDSNTSPSHQAREHWAEIVSRYSL